MLARILPLLSLVILGVLTYYVWSQGILDRIMNPTVVVVETKRQLNEGMRVKKDFIRAKEIPITRVEPGMIAFPSGTGRDVVERTLSTETVGIRVKKGKVLKSGMLARKADFVILMAGEDIAAGDSITPLNIRAQSLETVPPRGAIVFNSEEEALIYISRAYDLTAKTPISRGQIMTIDDTAGGAERVFVIRAIDDFARAEQLSINGLETAEISSRDMPRGAVAFPSRAAADLFITMAERYVAARRLETGDFVTAEVLSGGEAVPVVGDGELPRTMTELSAFMSVYPDQAMFLDEGLMLGELPEPEALIDIWIETGRTTGAFGEIRLVRVAKSVPVHVVYDNEKAAEEARRIRAAVKQGGLEIDAEELRLPEPDEHLWIMLDEKDMGELRRAQQTERFVFAYAGEIPLVDRIGNGAACLGDFCRVDRDTSKDMKAIQDELDAGEAASEIVVAQSDPLQVIDGVGPELEARMIANGYDSFESISSWQDSQIPAVTFQLDISNNLAVYIRQQARILVDSAETARKELGMAETPAE